ncbi:MAG: hypothetical protein M0Q51_05280 [Bacteroidales bacterium]|nr:hypothetical protein [Bacteroidales bacterium]
MNMNKLSLWLLSGLLLIIGCGKPTDPESLVPDDISGGYKIVKIFPTSGYAQDVLKKDSLLYIAQGEGGLLILSVADPENPNIVSLTTEYVRGYSSKIAMKDSAVYLAAATFGVTVINAADPDTPFVTVSNLGMKPARSFHILGNYMFAAVSEQGVNIADISYPTEPDIRGTISTTGYAYGLTTSADSNYLFAACGEMGLSIYDISNFLDGFGIYPQVGWCDAPGDAEAITILDDEKIAFLACGTGGLQIFDYSDTNNIFIAGSYDSIGYAKDLIYNNDLIYMTTETYGLQIIDVSDITKPYLVGILPTAYALGLEMDENYIYVADEIEGLIIISIPD